MLPEHSKARQLRTPAEFLFVGTHRRALHADTADQAFGIYTLRRDRHSQQLQAVGLTESPQPGWMAVHPAGRILYCVSELRQLEGLDGGGVSAFAVDPQNGALTRLNSRRTGALPCHCAVDASGRFLLVATFGGGSVHLFPLAADGQIQPESDAHQHVGSSVHPIRQTMPHAHGVHIHPDNRHVFVPDMGTDRVVRYELDVTAAKLWPHRELDVALPPGSGPRHLAFDQLGRYAYLLNEMSATVTTLTCSDPAAPSQARATVDLLPAGFTGFRSGAEIAVHPGGRFLYASTRSHGSSGLPPQPGLDTIVWFGIDATDGSLHRRGSIPSGGAIPRSFCFDTEGRRLYVGHQRSGSIVSFDIDPQNGEPTPTGETVATPVPVCLQFHAMG